MHSRSETTKRKHKPGRQNKRGRRPKFTPERNEWLQEKYRRDVKANPLLARHENAIPHVQGLAKTNIEIDAPGTTWCWWRSFARCWKLRSKSFR